MQNALSWYKRYGLLYYNIILLLIVQKLHRICFDIVYYKSFT